MQASPLAGDALQFDRAEPVDPAGPSDTATPVVRCNACSASPLGMYFDVSGETVCGSCKEQIERDGVPVRGALPTLRAVTYGFGAAILGAVIYYGVIAITDFEIGLVAILIGYMVGWAIRRGAGGRGGRRLQVAGIALTYFAVALAYTPLAMRDVEEEITADADAVAMVEAPGAAEPPLVNDEAVTSGLLVMDSAYVVAQAGEPGAESAVDVEVESAMTSPRAFAIIAVFVLALPLAYVFGTMPTGLISALIIGFGMHQAWRMTGATKLVISGPLRVGGAGDVPDPEPVR